MLTLLTALITTLTPLHAEQLVARVVLTDRAAIPTAIVEVENPSTLLYLRCLALGGKDSVVRRVLTYRTLASCYPLGPEIENSASKKSELAARLDHELQSSIYAIQGWTKPRLINLGSALTALTAASYVAIVHPGRPITTIAAAAAGWLSIYGLNRLIVPSLGKEITEMARVRKEFTLAPGTEASMPDPVLPDQIVDTYMMPFVERALARSLRGVAR